MAEARDTKVVQRMRSAALLTIFAGLALFWATVISEIYSHV